METTPSLDPVPAWPRGYRIGFVSALAAVLGVLAGLVAYGLYDLIGLFTNLAFYQRFSFHFLSPSVERVRQLGLWVVLVPVVGGLIIGLMVRYGSEKIRGHGIPEAMEAVLVGRSRIEPRVAILKPLSAALAIGTGGPFGAEGPIIQTGGAFGSLVGQLLSTTAAERRVLLACGAGAGMPPRSTRPLPASFWPSSCSCWSFVRGRLFPSSSRPSWPPACTFCSWADSRCSGCSRLTTTFRPVCPGTRCWGFCAAWPPPALPGCCTGWRIVLKNCLSRRSCIRHSARWAWA